MRRRDVVTILCAAAASSPRVTRAQLPKIARIGYLGLVSASSHARRVEAFRAGLQDLGYIENRTISIEFRWAEGKYDRLPALAAELVRLNVDVIVTHAAAGGLAAKQATSTIPIVITAVGDMLGLGLISSLARPGGNVTGLTLFTPELAAKRLELLKEFVPSLTRAAVLLNPDNPATGLIFQALESTAKALKVGVQRFEARGPSDIERAFASMASQRIGAAVVHEDTVLNANARAIANLAAAQKLPACGFPEFAAAGGLMAYGINFPDMERRAASYVDKILKGAKPADLPVEQASKFELVINVKTAKTLGLTIPQTLLQRADQRIE